MSQNDAGFHYVVLPDGVRLVLECEPIPWWRYLLNPGTRVSQHCDHNTGESRWWPQHGLVEHYAPVIECCRCHRQVQGRFWYDPKRIRRIKR